MVAGETLYQKVVHITYDYLGPAADRFVARQIKNHLHKDPEKLKKDDLKKLIDWITLAVNLLSEDDALISQYVASLKRLATTERGRRDYYERTADRHKV
jgi:hypothetical protein